MTLITKLYYRIIFCNVDIIECDFSGFSCTLSSLLSLGLEEKKGITECIAP